MQKLALHWQILIGLVLAVLLGVFFDERTELFGVSLTAVLGFLGEIFLRALKMLVIPLIVSSVIVGIAQVGDRAGVGRLGLKTLLYYLASSMVAIVTGLFLVVAIEPGVVGGEPAKDLIGLSRDSGAVADSMKDRGAADLVGIVLRMIPTNVLGDAAAGEMLGVIVFSLLFGYFATLVSEAPRRALVEFWRGVYEVMLKMTDFVLLFAPIGVFGLVGRVALTTGADALGPLSLFFFTVLAGLALHMFLSLPLALLFVARVKPYRHFRIMVPALLMAFSTASSAGTLPLTMERAKEAGVSDRVVSFTLPLGATVNMDGTALYECVAAVFIAQAYGIHLGVGELFVITVVALMTSIGVAGIPAASLVAITLILTTMGLPVEGVGLILAVDRLLDMCRTAVNVFSDSCAAVIIGRSEGEAGILQNPDARPS